LTTAKKVAVAQRVVVLRGKSSVLDNAFLKYALMSPFCQSEIASRATGTTVLGIKQSDLREIRIQVPPLKEQRKIAKVLGLFDSKIELNKKMNRTLESIAHTIFKNWFIDFEPFQECEFIDGALGKMPAEWKVKPLGDVARLSKGLSYSSSEISIEPKGALFITLNNFLRRGGFKEEYKYYSGSNAKEEHIVKEGDLIVALTDMTPEARVVGAPAVVVLPEIYNYGIISLDCAKLKPLHEHLELYLYLYLKRTQKENSTFAHGVNVLHLDTKLFMSNKRVILPPQRILDKFHLLVYPLFQKIILNKKENMLLQKIRDGLLPLLLHGELRLKGD
jgi:type I restriction enzyme S subunit